MSAAASRSHPVEADYVVVGAGSAGCVLAHRLSESGRSSVLVLEAGGSDRRATVRIPAGFMKTYDDPRVNWCYRAQPHPATGDRAIFFPRGKVVGGSSSINGHLYVRGHPRDYDTWAQLGNRGWSYDEVLPYFRRGEDRDLGPDGYHGAGGPQHVSEAAERHPLSQAFIEAAQRNGIAFNPDYNGRSQDGVGYAQRTIRRGRRHSAADGYLRPALRRSNVALLTGVLVERLILDGRRAVGVAFRQGDRLREARARREVLVCGGAVGSPRLLQLSGIGPPELLLRHGISVIHRLDGVGEGLVDHYAVRVSVRVDRPITLNERAHGWRLAREIVRYCLRRDGILSLSPAHLTSFVHTRDGLEQPDVQILFTPASYSEGATGRLNRFPGMTCAVYQLRPESRGHVRISDPDPGAEPIIQPRYLTERVDCDTLVAGLKLARRLLGTPPLDAFGEREILPGPAVGQDHEWLAHAREHGATVYHPVGTCRMGPDPGAVVDDRLRVRGIEALRVVDASIMPTMVSGNTNAATLMIAEKAADLIDTGT